MERFMCNALEILDAAEATARAGQPASDVTVLMSAQNGIRLVMDSDWSLESLATEHGAEMAYRVSRDTSKVRVDGRSGLQTCRIETEISPAAVLSLMSRQTNYKVVPQRAALPAASQAIARYSSM